MQLTVEFSWIIWVEEHVSNFYKKKIVWQFDVTSHVTQDLGDTRLF